MEFITAEEFLNQTEKVQQELINWWKPSIGDLFFRTKYKWLLYHDNKEDYEEEIQCIADISNNKIFPTVGEAYSHISNCYEKDEVIPLLTEGQLRQFIEDKSEGKVEFYPDIYKGKHFYTIMIRETGCDGDDPEFEPYADDTLQAYWKVACKIAKEEIK